MHLHRLSGFNVLEKLESGITAKRDNLMSFFKSASAHNKELAAKLSQVDLTSQSVAGIIYLLMAYFREDDSVLFQGFEVNSKTHCIFPCFINLSLVNLT